MDPSLDFNDDFVEEEDDDERFPLLDLSPPVVYDESIFDIFPLFPFLADLENSLCGGGFVAGQNSNMAGVYSFFFDNGFAVDNILSWIGNHLENGGKG